MNRHGEPLKGAWPSSNGVVVNNWMATRRATLAVAMTKNFLK